MKITTIEKETDNGNYFKIILETNDGKESLTFYDGDPEDNNLARNFNDCYCVTELIRAAYRAGKNGETCEEFDYYQE